VNQPGAERGCGEPAVEVNNWGNPTTLLSPQFVRLQVQFGF